MSLVGRLAVAEQRRLGLNDKVDRLSAWFRFGSHLGGRSAFDLWPLRERMAITSSRDLYKEASTLLRAISRRLRASDQVGKFVEQIARGIGHYDILADWGGDDWQRWFAQDALWHARGSSHLAGDFRGHEEIHEMRQRSFPGHIQLLQPIHTTKMVDWFFSPSRLVVLRDYKSEVPDDPFESLNGHIFLVDQSRHVREVWRFDVDQAEFDQHVARWQSRPAAERRELVDAWRESRKNSVRG